MYFGKEKKKGEQKEGERELKGYENLLFFYDCCCRCYVSWKNHSRADCF